MATAVMKVPFEIVTDYSPRSSGVPVQILMQAMQYLPLDCVVTGVTTNNENSSFEFGLYSKEFNPETLLIAKFKTEYTENLPGLFGKVHVFDGIERHLLTTSGLE